MKRVLTIDGGGIRGLVPAMICSKLEELSKKPIGEQFDLIAGTSTGGIIALGLACGVDAKLLLEIYEQKGNQIFSNPKINLVTYKYPKYDSTGLESILKNHFENRRLSGVPVKVMITAYDLMLREPLIFKSWGIVPDSENDYTLEFVARATSAAPTFFTPAYLKANKSAVDGGLYCNNPGLIAYLEAERLWGDEEISVLSLGTGSLSTSILYNDAKDWGKIQWSLPLLDCVFDGVSKITDTALKILADNKKNNFSYFRLQFPLDGSYEMDDVSDHAISNLTRLGNTLLGAKIDVLSNLMEVKVREKDQLESPDLDTKSKYLRYRTADIVLEDLKLNQMYLDNLQITPGFTVSDLVARCHALYHNNFSDQSIHKKIFLARAHAFTVKYAEAREDEKLLDPQELKIPDLRHWSDYLNDIIDEYSLEINALHVMDVGAGNGQANIEIYRSINSLKLVDISEKALSIAKKSIPQAVIIVASAEELTVIPDDSINVYFSFRTFQSTLFDVKAALHEAYRVLARNGVLIISIPTMFPMKDGTVSRGLLRQGERKPSEKYAHEVAKGIADTAKILAFKDVRVDDRSPFELYVLATHL